MNLILKMSSNAALVMTVLVGALGCSAPAKKATPIVSEKKLEKNIQSVDFPPAGVKLRAGYILEQAPLKACVLYLEGVNDSITDHDPYFKALSEAGYRVLFYDYLGQGGSGGNMNDSRIQVSLSANASEVTKRNYNLREKYFSIPEQSQFIWNRFKHVKNDQGVDCLPSKKLVIGWSAGALAGYRQAHEKTVDAVVLITPEIHPQARQTKRNPSVDRQHLPSVLPQFSRNLKLVSSKAIKWKIDPSVKGLVFLEDANNEIMAENAPHFEVEPFELSRVRAETIRFFDEVTASAIK